MHFLLFSDHKNDHGQPLSLLLVGLLDYVNWWRGADSAPTCYVEN